MTHTPAETPSPTQTKPRRSLTVLLTVLVAFGPVSTDLYLPSLPDIVRFFGAEVTHGQLTLSVFTIGFAVSQLIYGPLSDRFGRRPVLLGGIVTYVVGSLLCLFAPSMGALLAARFVQAVGACSGPVLGRAIVRDLYPRDQAARVMAYMASAMALAPAVAPIIGGWAHSLFGWRSTFVLLVLFGLGLLVATPLMLAETNRHKDEEATRPRRVLGNYWALLGDTRYMGYVATAAFSFAALFSFISGSSFVVIDVLGVRPENFGFVFACASLGYVSGSFVAGRFSPRIGLLRMIAFGNLVLMIAGLLLAGFALAGVQTVASVIVPVSLLFFGVGQVLPNSTASAIAPHARMAGSASAMIGFLQMSVGAVAGWLVGRLFGGTTMSLAGVVMAMVTISSLSFYFLVWRRERS